MHWRIQGAEWNQCRDGSHRTGGAAPDCHKMASMQERHAAYGEMQWLGMRMWMKTSERE